jgi:hypothetical protein
MGYRKRYAMKIVNFILCDDIRKELGNKISLMGVYRDSIEFLVTADKTNSWPKNRQMSFLLDFQISSEIVRKAKKFQIFITYQGKESIIAKGPLDQPQKNETSVKPIRLSLLVSHAFTFPSEGRLEFKVQLMDESQRVLETASPDIGFDVLERF